VIYIKIEKSSRRIQLTWNKRELFMARNFEFAHNEIDKSKAQLANEVVDGVSASLKRVDSLRNKADALAQGQLFELADQDKMAEREYRKLLAHADKDISLEALARYAIVLLKQKRHDEALAAAERLTAMAPKYTLQSVVSGETYSSHTLLGEALFQQGRHGEAVKSFTAALKVLPEDPFVSGRLALLYLANDKPKEATALAGAAAKSSRYAGLANSLALVESGVLVGRISAERALAAVAGTAVGRPFRVDGTRLAGLADRSDWIAE
jgi:tetratricopeptide (TPR) repeat protein